jgi:hypothetical protein
MKMQHVREQHLPRYFLSNLMSKENKDMQHVRDMAQFYGNLIETRWKKLSRVKRADLLSSASPGLFPLGARERLDSREAWSMNLLGSASPGLFLRNIMDV